MGQQFKSADVVSKTISSVRLQGTVVLITGTGIAVTVQSRSAAVQYGTCIIRCASPSRLYLQLTTEAKNK